MGNQVVSIKQRGVERHNAPSLAEDGGAIECINLRPTANGLELVHDKRLYQEIQFLSSVSDTVTGVYRHRALPRDYYIVILNKRRLYLYGPSEKGGMERKRNKAGDFGYPAVYDEEILSIGELNNILVVRTSTQQDYYLWHDNEYSKMPAIAMPDQMMLTQAFDENNPVSIHDRPFFQAVAGFYVPKDDGDGFDMNYKNNLNQALQFIQGLRSEEESKQRRLGKFVGHVLVRCAFRTAQNNYVSYGPVLHTEVGTFSQIGKKVSKFGKSDDEEKPLPWYQTVFAKIIDDYHGQTSNILIPDGRSTEVRWSLWPISCFRDGDSDGYNESLHPEFSVIHAGLTRNAGYSQPPVYVGALPYSVYVNKNFRGDNNVASGFIQGDEPEERHRIAIGVYAPGIIYSYPVLKIKFDKQMVADLRYYKDKGIIKSFCVSMTAPVKHGYGNSLVKVRTLQYDFFQKFNPIYWNNGSRASAPLYLNDDILVSDVGQERGNNDVLDVYGYTRNIDTDPERLMNKIFYIVKDIELSELLKDTNLNETGEYEIPLQLKDIGVIEEVKEDGTVTVTTSAELVSNSQSEQIDPNYVSLNTIESAKPLPTDNFSAHTLLGTKYMEYNRRLHMFGVETILSKGYFPSPIIKKSDIGYGGNRILAKGDDGFVENLYFETIIETEGKSIVRRMPIEAYMVESNSAYNMVVNDILSYPDYRGKYMRIVKKCIEGGKEIFRMVSSNWECKNSILNNLSYVAFTSKNPNDLNTVSLKLSKGLTIWSRIENRWGGKKDGNFFIAQKAFCKKEDTGAIDISRAHYSYKDDDTLLYYDAVLDIGRSDSEYPIVDYDGLEVDSCLMEGNRIQVSETDDVFSYPTKNSYRVGSIDNQIIAANSVYGQVTEQKFGMFPLYIFSKEGIFTLEQGTGDILYLNVSKINDDRLTDSDSICNAGDMIAFVVADGVRLIQGKQTQQVSDMANGNLFIDLLNQSGCFFDTINHIPSSSFKPVSFIDYISRVRLADEIQGCKMLWDSYNHEVILLCNTGNKITTWAYNVKSQQFYKRRDILNESTMVNEEIEIGLVQNEKNKAWSISRGNVVSGKIFKTISLWDFSSSDQSVNGQGNPDKQQFIYVSNPVKAGTNGYKHIEHSILRMFGTDVDIRVEFFGSLDAKKWFFMGGGEIRNEVEYSDMKMRRMPCSVRYIIVVVKGEATALQISQLDTEIRMMYSGKLR